MISLLSINDMLQVHRVRRFPWQPDASYPTANLSSTRPSTPFCRATPPPTLTLVHFSSRALDEPCPFPNPSKCTSFHNKEVRNTGKLAFRPDFTAGIVRRRVYYIPVKYASSSPSIFAAARARTSSISRPTQTHVAVPPATRPVPI